MPGDIELIYRRTAWKAMEPSDSAVRHSKFFCWVEFGGEKVGAIAVDLYKIDCSLDNEDFIDVMDYDSQHAYLLADALCEAWDDVPREIALWGPIAEVSGVWLDRRVAGRVSIMAIADALNGRVLTNYSIAVLRTIPLDGVDRSVDRRQRRTAALERHWRRVFRAMPFPGRDKTSRWMLSINLRNDDPDMVQHAVNCARVTPSRPVLEGQRD